MSPNPGPEGEDGYGGSFRVREVRFEIPLASHRRDEGEPPARASVENSSARCSTRRFERPPPCLPVSGEEVRRREMLPDVGDHPLAEELPSGAVLTEFPGAQLLQAGVEQGGHPMRDLSPSSGESLEVSRGRLRACTRAVRNLANSVPRAWVGRSSESGP